MQATKCMRETQEGLVKKNLIESLHIQLEVRSSFAHLRSFKFLLWLVEETGSQGEGFVNGGV